MDTGVELPNHRRLGHATPLANKPNEIQVESSGFLSRRRLAPVMAATHPAASPLCRLQCRYQDYRSLLQLIV